MKKTLCLLALSLGLSSCQTTPNDKQNVFSNPNSPEALFRVAESMHQAGDDNTAARIYQQVLTIDVNHARAQIGLGKSLSRLNHFDEAIDVLTNYAQKHPNDIAVYKELGQAYIAHRKPKQALGILMMLHEWSPKDPSILTSLGVCHDLLKNHNKAQEWYRQALKISPKNHSTLSNLGLSLVLSGDSQKALQILEPLNKKPEASPKDRHNLAMAYGFSGNLEKAAQIFSTDLDDSAVRNNLAYIHKALMVQKASLATKKLASEENEMALAKSVITENHDLTDYNFDVADTKADILGDPEDITRTPLAEEPTTDVFSQIHRKDKELPLIPNKNKSLASEDDDISRSNIQISDESVPAPSLERDVEPSVENQESFADSYSSHSLESESKDTHYSDFDPIIEGNAEIGTS